MLQWFKEQQIVNLYSSQKPNTKDFKKILCCPLLWPVLTHLLIRGVCIWYFLLFKAMFTEAETFSSVLIKI